MFGLCFGLSLLEGLLFIVNVNLKGVLVDYGLLWLKTFRKILGTVCLYRLSINDVLSIGGSLSSDRLYHLVS